MEIATLAIAVAGVLLGALSLGWQAATFFLSGPRVRVRLRAGLFGPGGVVVGKPEAVLVGDQRKRLEHEGFTEPVLAVTAVNGGRLPTTINSWGIVVGGGVTLREFDAHGPSLPHRLEPHEEATWYASAANAMAAVAASAATFGERSARMIRAQIETPAGGVVVSGEWIGLAADGAPRLRFPLRRRLLAGIRRKPLV
jgi:hypothetical protein